MCNFKTAALLGAVFISACSSTPDARTGVEVHHPGPLVYRLEEVPIQEDGAVTAVSGRVEAALYGSDSGYMPVAVGDVIRNKTLVVVDKEASLAVQFGQGETVEFLPAPAPRHIIFRYRRL